MEDADAALVDRDPGLPGLPVLLDDDLLARWTARHAPSAGTARRRYLRYKPGTSCVLGLTVDGPAGPRSAVLSAVSGADLDKQAKTAERAPAGSVLGHDRDAGLLLHDLAGDRDLPGLADLLADPAGTIGELLAGSRPVADWTGVELVELRYKPQRRWVALARPRTGNPVLLRAHRGPAGSAAADALVGLAGGHPRVPRLLGSAVGIAVVEWVPGDALDGVLRDGTADPADLAAAGAALARLHARAPGDLRRAGPQEAADAVRAAADTVGTLLPALADRARSLAGRLAPRLAPSTATVCHGDFSADQVVRTAPGRVALTDLDEARVDDPATDLGSAAAAAAVQGVPAHTWAAFSAGYATRCPLPEPTRLAAHTAAALLRTAPEPFRGCHPGWPARVAARLTAAELAVDPINPSDPRTTSNRSTS